MRGADVMPETPFPALAGTDLNVMADASALQVSSTVVPVSEEITRAPDEG